MANNILVVNAAGPEIRVGVKEDNTLAEYFVERRRGRGITGNIYMGRVTRVLPGMQAAFVDLGPTVERAGFLYVGDVLGVDDAAKVNAIENGGGRRRRKGFNEPERKIDDVLKPNQKVLVQIVKDPIGLKGARVTGYLSLPGRYSVLMPHVEHVGVSRRIATDKERKRLKRILDESRPEKMGVIVRTAAEGAPEQEIRDDINYLERLSRQIQGQADKKGKPGLVYTDLDLSLRSVRDLLRENIAEVNIDCPDEYARVRKFVSAFMPSYVDRIRLYEGRAPIFDYYGISADIRNALSRRVPLKSGGHLVIDHFEALTAIDVNTGSFVGKDDLEATVTANNMEACREIARQLRIRNIGGIIVLDFVDMEKEENRRMVWDEFNKAIAKDPCRSNVTKISELGLVEMTRKRTRESLSQMLLETCPRCDGQAMVPSATTIAHEAIREVRRSLANEICTSVVITCSPGVASVLKGEGRQYLNDLEKKFHKQVSLDTDSEVGSDQFSLQALGSDGELPKEPAKASGSRNKNDRKPAAKNSREKQPPRKNEKRKEEKAPASEELNTQEAQGEKKTKARRSSPRGNTRKSATKPKKSSASSGNKRAPAKKTSPGNGKSASKNATSTKPSPKSTTRKKTSTRTKATGTKTKTSARSKR